MSIPLPNLDDRGFDELVEEGRRLIPGLAPSWTDHNASDPGITFIELFAFVTEMLLYRADRVSEANKRAFVRLLRGDPAAVLDKPIDEEIRDAVLTLRRENRAVMAVDFVRLAETYFSAVFPAGEPGVRATWPVARAFCLLRCNADMRPRHFDLPSHVSVLIVPGSPLAQASLPGLIAELLRSDIPSQQEAGLQRPLGSSCLLTTRLHVAEPRYLKLLVDVEVHVFADQQEATVLARVKDSLARYFDRLHGGAEGTGWPFGQAVYVSALYALLDAVEGVDYVTPGSGRPLQALDAADPADRNIIDGGQFVGLRLEPDELLDFQATQSIIVRRAAASPQQP
jgi:hypothetical protein